MRPMRYTAILLLGLTACSATPPELPSPPPGFPDLNAFNPVDRNDFKVAGPSFVTAEQVDCRLDRGSTRSVICDGDIAGFPNDIPGDGCPVARKPDGAPGDTPYVLTRWDHPCTSARSMPISTGKKLVGDNSTCVVGKNNLVACIDADHKHGFVLQPSGSWTF